MANFSKIFVVFFLSLTLITSCTPLSAESHSAADAIGGVEGEVYSVAQYQEVSLSKSEAKTRNASMKIYNQRGGHGSGAYFLFQGYHVVFTAAHVVSGSPINTVVDKNGNRRTGALVYIDHKIDFAIILVPRFKDIEPLKLKLPEYNPSEEIGRNLIFSGFPGSQSLRTTRGVIAGVEGRYFVMHSTAWSGSSGSCVFDSKGNFVGILFALSVSRFSGEPVLLESMAWVEPYTAIDWKLVKDTIDSLN